MSSPSCVLEKGSEVGAHILSGAVIDPVGLDALIPDWREQGLAAQHQGQRGPVLLSVEDRRHPRAEPLHAAADEQSRLLHRQPRQPLPLARRAGGSARRGNLSGLRRRRCDLRRRTARSKASITGDMGVARDGSHKDNYTPGIALVGKYTLFAEGARGSLSKMLIAKLGLDAEIGPQKFGIGLKELWEVPAEKHRPGLVQHTMGWPLDDKTGGGSFLYHFGERLVSVGFVVHLDYANPYLNPFKEFQRAKTHPLIAQASQRRQAHRLWRARAHRRRLAGHPAACLSRRRADRLRRGLHERAAHQGQSQRHAVAG